MEEQEKRENGNALTAEDAGRRIRAKLGKVLVGQEETVNYLLAGLFSGGHALIEGVPGIAKTLTVKLLAEALNLSFKRIQFTPDLMPADVTGNVVYHTGSGAFEFRKGPVFSNIVLIDEINRAPAKTQAALFEVMEEKQVTADGITYKLPDPFMVLATQNPVEQEGTYRLPEAQLDRFLFRIRMGYPSVEEEMEILRRFGGTAGYNSYDASGQVLGAEHIQTCVQEASSVLIREELIAYIASIATLTRNSPDLFLGMSPRASLAVVKTSKAMAALDGRNYVTPEDIRKVLDPVLNHRLILSPEREMEGFTVADILDRIISEVEVPR